MAGCCGGYQLDVLRSEIAAGSTTEASFESSHLTHLSCAFILLYHLVPSQHSTISICACLPL